MKISYSLPHLPSFLLQQDFTSCSEYGTEVIIQRGFPKALKFKKKEGDFGDDLSTSIEITSLKKAYNHTSTVYFPTAFLENYSKTGLNKWVIKDSCAGIKMAYSLMFLPIGLRGGKRTEILPANIITFQKTQAEKLNLQNEKLRISPTLPHLWGRNFSQL